MISPLRSVESRSRSSSLEPARQTAMSCCCISPEEPFDPACKLAFQLRAVHHDNHCRCAEILLGFQDHAGGGKQCERLAGPLGVPDESAPLHRLATAFDNAFHRAALVLAQHGFPGFAILYVEENPVSKRAQEVGGFEE